MISSFKKCTSLKYALLACTSLFSFNAYSQILSLYSSRHYDIDKELYERFTKETGIKIQHTQMEAGEALFRLKQEDNNSPADLFITADVANLSRTHEAGLFAALSSKNILDKVPVQYREKSGHWVAISKRARVIVYNTQLVSEKDAPLTYEELALPKWKGKLASRSSTHVYTQSLMASLIASIGPEKALTWAKGVHNNFARKPEGNDTEQIKFVASGKAHAALVNSYYVARLSLSTNETDIAVIKNIRMVFPNQADRGTHVNISGIGVLKSSKQKNNAERFVEFLLSKDSQDLFSSGNNEYPVVEGIAPHPTLASFGTFKADSHPIETIGSLNAQALKLLDESGWR